MATASGLTTDEQTQQAFNQGVKPLTPAPFQKEQFDQYKKVDPETYADLKFNPEETRPYTYDLSQEDRGVSKFDIAMDNLTSAVSALVQLNSYAVNPISKFSSPELDWMPEYNSGMEQIVDVAKKDPVKFTKAVAQGALESTWNLATQPEVVVPEYIANISGAVKDQFTKSIDDYLRQMYGPETTVFNATDEQLTEARGAMLFRTLEATEAFGITAIAPKAAKAVAKGGIDSYYRGADFINSSVPVVKQNILKIAEGLTSSSEEAMGLVPIGIDFNRRNNTAKSDLDFKISAMIAPATSGDIKASTGSMYRADGWGSRASYPVAKQKLENYFEDLEDQFDYDFEENFTEDFKKLSIFHQEEALQFLNTVWKEHGWTLGPNNQLFTEIPDNLAVFKANDFIKGSFSDIKNPSVWEFIIAKAKRPFDSGPQPVAIPGQTGDYSFNYYDVDGNVKSFGTSIDPPMFRLGELLDHKELYKAYPELKNLKIKFFDNQEIRNKKGTLGYFAHGNPKDDYIAMNYGRFAGKSPKEYVPTLLHEIQHAIEQRSGVDITGKNTVNLHLRKKLDFVDETLIAIQQYNNNPSLIDKNTTAFLQGTEQGNYNIIFLNSNNIISNNATAKENLKYYLAKEHKITADVDGYGPTSLSSWREIDLKTAENLLKIQLYEAKNKLGGRTVDRVSPSTNKTTSDIFGQEFISETAVVDPQTFFDKINQLAFKYDPNIFSPEAGDVFAHGKSKTVSGSSPEPKLGLNMNPDFFNEYLSTISEVMAKITESSHRMTLGQRKKSLPYERAVIGAQEAVITGHGPFGWIKTDYTNKTRNFSLSELVYSMTDKNTATQSLEKLHANLVESIKSSSVMKDKFYPMMVKATTDANMNPKQIDKYYEDWVNGFADALLFSRHNPHVIMGTNVKYAKMKLGQSGSTTKSFTEGLRDFGLEETALLIQAQQQSFLKHYLETMKDAGKNLSELELLNELDNVYKSTRIKPEEIQNVTPEFGDKGEVTALSATENYRDAIYLLTIDGKKYGGY